MYTPITRELTSTVIAERIREAESARLARSVRRTTTAAGGLRPQRPFVRQWTRRFRTRIVAAH